MRTNLALSAASWIFASSVLLLLAGSWTALRLVPGQPAGPAAVTMLLTWLLLIGRRDLAPQAGQ